MHTPERSICVQGYGKFRMKPFWSVKKNQKERKNLIFITAISFPATNPQTMLSLSRWRQIKTERADK